MSGFEHGGYTLTATKAGYWHGRHCAMDTRTAEQLTELVETHLIPRGFRVTRRPSPFAVTVEGPGLAERSTSRLFEALSGRPSRR